MGNTNDPSQVMKILGYERFMAYVADGADLTVGMARHQLNMALSEALYPALHSLEIALRNAINERLQIMRTREDWYQDDVVLTNAQQRTVAAVHDKLGRTTKDVRPSNVISTLPLGFWTSFFNKALSNQAQLTQLIRPVFSYAPRHQLSIPSIDGRLTAFRHLRNRVFHHERIIHWTDLPERHRQIVETLGWISPVLATICAANDRFGAVHKAGLRPWL